MLLEQGSTELTAMFMSRVREFAFRLATVMIDALMPLIALIVMNHNTYISLIARFTSGEPAVVGASVETFEKLMLKEDSRHLAM